MAKEQITLNPLHLDSMPREPAFALLIVRHGTFQTAPEGRSVVGLVQVDELVNDHVLGNVARQ